jgi:Tol biopolymer transport system component
VPEGAPPVIAPGVPHYALWSPDGSRIAYVAPAPEGLTLFSGDIDGPLVSNPIVTGAPLFFAWSKGGRLAVHAGPELLLLDEALERRTTLTSSAIGFRTPAFSSDGGFIAYATPAPPGVAIMLAPVAEPVAPRELHRLPGGVALAFAPGSALLGVSLTRQPESGLFHELWLIDAVGESPPRRIHHGPFVASFWAPGGESVMLVVPGASGEGRYFPQTIGLDGSILGTGEGITPSPEYRVLLSFFDQYALSHSPWSPDGRAFVMAGRPPGDGVPSSLGDPTNYVIIWRPGRAVPLEVVCPGDAGFFGPMQPGMGGS